MEQVQSTPRKRLNGRNAALLIGALLLALATVMGTCVYQKSTTPLTTSTTPTTSAPAQP